MKTFYKNKSISLRKSGLSYSEILQQVPVAKSTLSLWLREIGLSKSQKQRFTTKKLEAAKKGALLRKQKYEGLKIKIRNEALQEIKDIDNEKLWLLGIILYWAEGAKDKGKGSRVIFSNSDPKMLNLFLKWLKECIKIKDDQLIYQIYVHETYKNNLDEIRDYWAHKIDVPKSMLVNIYFKNDKINSNRKNRGNIYFGLLRIIIRKSNDLNRKISGWIEGICQQCGVV